MSKPLDVFCEIPCLTERSIPLRGLELQKKWFKTADKRYIVQYLQKFITYNSSYFDFLGVQPYILGSDKDVSLCFRSSEFVGAIPLRSSDTGKQIGDLVVNPRFLSRTRFEEYVEIIDLLGKTVTPEFKDGLPLASGRNFRPPLYLEAVKFVALLEDLVKTSWKKFDTLEKNIREPSGQVNWSTYCSKVFKVENQLVFPTRKNVLNEYHREYSELRYVFDLCKLELLSSQTPIRVKNSQRSRLLFLEEKLSFHKPIQTTNFLVHASDAPIVKLCKNQANKILLQNFIEGIAWRVDFSDLFEKFVQHVFIVASKETGGKVICNPRFHNYSAKHYSWELHHLEPDAIYQKGSTYIFIDAKYKSNLYNVASKSDQLREDHRHDLHQILAYSAFNPSDTKYCFLCYPSNNVDFNEAKFTNFVNGSSVFVVFCGIPLKKELFNNSKDGLVQKLRDIERVLLENERQKHRN